MRPVLTAEEMRRCDAAAIAAGTPSLQLMEHAAAGALAVLAECAGPLRGKRILILCGKGNNGGDGLALARLAKAEGARVTVAIAGSANDLRGDAKLNFKRLVRATVRRIERATARTIEHESCEIIVDALLGTGAVLPLQEDYRDLIRAANQRAAFRFAIDLPTGLTAEGEIDPAVVFHADATATLAAVKPGLLFGRGRECAGNVHLVSIGLPDELLDASRTTLRLLETADIAERFPARPVSANKYGMGKVFLLCGSRGMLGAGVLAARGAMRTGAGITVLGVPASLMDVAAAMLTETMIAPLPENNDGCVDDVALTRIGPRLAWGDAMVMGSGVSKHADALATVRAAVFHATVPVVLDADGLSAFAEHHASLRNAKVPVVITPHVAELAALVGSSRDEISRDPVGAARSAARELDVIVVLKGGPTVIATPGGVAYINPTGNPGMATAGAGDVLAGMIGAMIARGCAPLDAAITAVFLHGRAGDLAAAFDGVEGLIASDIVEHIPRAIQSLGIPSGAYHLPQ